MINHCLCYCLIVFILLILGAQFINLSGYREKLWLLLMLASSFIMQAAVEEHGPVQELLSLNHGKVVAVVAFALEAVALLLAIAWAYRPAQTFHLQDNFDESRWAKVVPSTPGKDS